MVRWSSQTRKLAIELAKDNSVYRVADMTGVPSTTIRDWLVQLQQPEEYRKTIVETYLRVNDLVYYSFGKILDKGIVTGNAYRNNICPETVYVPIMFFSHGRGSAKRDGIPLDNLIREEDLK